MDSFDFQNPNPSLNKEFNEVNKRAEQFYTKVMLEKRETIKNFTKDEKLEWALKAMVNAAANYIVVSHYILEEFLEEKGESQVGERFLALNLAHSTLTSQYIVPILGLMAQAKHDKTSEAEIDLLNRIMEL